MRTLNIPTNNDLFYKQLIALFNLLFGLTLTGAEIVVFSRILYHYNKFMDEGESPRAAMKFVFDYDVKVKIRDEVGGMSEKNFNNIMMRLRKKKVIGFDKITPTFAIKRDDFNKIVLNFKYEGGAKNPSQTTSGEV